MSAPCGRFLYALARLRIFTVKPVRIFTVKPILPGQAAHIYRYAKSVCAYLPLRLRIFTVTSAHIYRYVCAYLPLNNWLSTGFELGVYLFPLVAYNYKL